MSENVKRWKALQIVAEALHNPERFAGRAYLDDNTPDPADEWEARAVVAALDYVGLLDADYDALLAERDALREAGDALATAAENDADPDPCWTDHHGYCQAHSLTDPCTNAELLRTAADWRAARLQSPA